MVQRSDLVVKKQTCASESLKAAAENLKESVAELKSIPMLQVFSQSLIERKYRLCCEALITQIV